MVIYAMKYEFTLSYYDPYTSDASEISNILIASYQAYYDNNFIPLGKYTFFYESAPDAIRLYFI